MSQPRGTPTYQTINTSDQISCPVTRVLLTGETSSDYDLLSSAITAYSDGYRMRLLSVLGDLSIPSNAGTAGVCIGRDLTTSAAPSGAYCMTWLSATDANNNFSRRALETDIAGYNFTTAQWLALSGTFAVADPDAAVVDVTNLADETFYDYKSSPAYDSAAIDDVFIDEAIIYIEFYMPSELTI